MGIWRDGLGMCVMREWRDLLGRLGMQHSWVELYDLEVYDICGEKCSLTAFSAIDGTLRVCKATTLLESLGV